MHAQQQAGIDVMVVAPHDAAVSQYAAVSPDPPIGPDAAVSPDAAAAATAPARPGPSPDTRSGPSPDTRSSPSPDTRPPGRRPDTHPPGHRFDTHGTVAGVPVRWFPYAPTRLERLAYRGGLLAAARSPAALLIPPFLAAMTAAVRRATRDFQPDLIHAHWWFPAGFCALPASRRYGRPLVVTAHGSDLHLLRFPPLRPLARAVLRRAALVTAVSADAARLLTTLDPALRPTVLPLPVPPGPPLRPLPVCPPLRVLAAGRLVPEKGFDVLIDALRIAVGRGLDVQAEILGSGPLRPSLVSQAAPLAGRVRILPAVSREELAAHIDAAHVAVVPSRREGLGLVAVEALARGRFVIASRVGGLPEVIDDVDDGWLVAPEDPDALAAALLAAADKFREPDESGQNGQTSAPRRVALRHSPAKVGQSHRDAYSSVVLREGQSR